MVGALRGDGVAPSILGMTKLIGEDSLRRALSAIAPAPDDKHTAEQRAAQQGQLARSVQWMQDQLKHSIAQAPPRRGYWTATPPSRCSTASKTVPSSATTRTSPGAPAMPSTPTGSATCAWYWTRSLEPGNRHSPVHARPGLLALLQGMPQASRPRLVRGDCAFGSEGEMSALEAIGQPYLFKLRQSAGVKKLAACRT